jgi:predicted signal transduction protein with EAL and GGDEF domain
VDRTYEDLYRAADIAMYFAKAKGGNQAVFYSKDLLTQARGNTAVLKDGDARPVPEHNETGEDLR